MNYTFDFNQTGGSISAQGNCSAIHSADPEISAMAQQDAVAAARRIAYKKKLQEGASEEEALVAADEAAAKTTGRKSW